MELADTLGLGPSVARREGSSPFVRICASAQQDPTGSFPWAGVTHARRSLRPSVRQLSHCLGLLAQLVEQRTFNPWVEGSSPSQSIAEAKLTQGEVQNG